MSNYLFTAMHELVKDRTKFIHIAVKKSILLGDVVKNTGVKKYDRVLVRYGANPFFQLMIDDDLSEFECRRGDVVRLVIYKDES